MTTLQACEVFEVDKKWALRKRKEYNKQKLLKKRLVWFLKSDARRRLGIKIWLWKIDTLSPFAPIRKLKRLFKQLNILLYNKKDEALTLEQKKEIAKQIDIRELIQFNKNNFAPCIFHKEDTPSMRYYEKSNTVYCFGCNTWGDSIIVTSYICKCSYEQAIEILAGGKHDYQTLHNS